MHSRPTFRCGARYRWVSVGDLDAEEVSVEDLATVGDEAAGGNPRRLKGLFSTLDETKGYYEHGYCPRNSAMECCVDNIRFGLSDQSGELRFESFDIVDPPECSEVIDKLREYLIGRSLAEIDITIIRGLECLDSDLCMERVAGMIEEYQEFFGVSSG